MALDLEGIPPEKRAALIAAGEKYGSTVTLAQAQQTLGGLGKHAAKLVDHGFGEEDHKKLGDCAEGLIAAGVGRDTKVSDKKTTNKAYTDAMRTAQKTRMRAQSVLENGRRALSWVPGDAAAAAVRSIDTVLGQTSVAGDTAEKLASQLDQLGTALAIPEVVEATKGRGGPKAVTDTAAHAVALRTASQTATHPRGTPQETEKLDLIDGIILELVRDARHSAEIASKELGEPALLAEFELFKLYPSSKSKKAPEPSPEAKPLGAPGSPDANPIAESGSAPKGDGTG